MSSCETDSGSCVAPRRPLKVSRKTSDASLDVETIVRAEGGRLQAVADAFLPLGRGASMSGRSGRGSVRHSAAAKRCSSNLCRRLHGRRRGLGERVVTMGAPCSPRRGGPLRGRRCGRQTSVCASRHAQPRSVLGGCSAAARGQAASIGRSTAVETGARTWCASQKGLPRMRDGCLVPARHNHCCEWDGFLTDYEKPPAAAIARHSKLSVRRAAVPMRRTQPHPGFAERRPTRWAS